jgi:hypothetical protein
MAEQTAAPAPQPTATQAQGNAPPGENTHGETEAPENPTPPPFDPAKAGLVFRDGSYGFVEKVDGQEVWFPLDEQTRGKARLGMAAQRRMDEAARTKQEADAVIRGLEGALTQRDPKARARAIEHILGGLNVDVAETVNAWVEEQKARAALSPEQRELQDARAREAEARAEAKRLQEERQQAEHEARMRQTIRTADAALTAGLTAAGVDSTDPYLRHAVLSRMEAMIYQNQREPSDAEVTQWYTEAAKHVADRQRKAIPKLLKSIADDALLEMMGEEQVGRVLARKLDAQKAGKDKPKAPPPVRNGAAARADASTETREPQTPGERIAAARKAGTWKGYM